ncbi:MAG: YqeG family HAD IIIA-type phosphatase [Oscillospiraceae bacterium]|nr:YqeG family HAD IIIA-type phosphatase [Oscillospiraceae bacterium]
MKKPIILVEDVCQITPELLKKRGIRAVLSDLDNTVAGYRSNVPDKAVGVWIKSLKDALIPLLVVSNAGKKRVMAFCDPLGLPFVARAGKPGSRGILDALKRLGVSPSEAVMVGDQYRTDIRAGHRAGVHVILVPPRVKGFLSSFRRSVENHFVKRSIELL